MKLGLTGRIARASAKRPWLTIGAWALIIAAAVVASGSIGNVLTQDERMLVQKDSVIADEINELRIDNEAPDEELIVVASDTYAFGDASFMDALADAAAAVTDIEGVETVVSPTLDAPVPVSDSGRAALISATLALDHTEDTGVAINEALAALEHDGFQFAAYGETTGEATFNALAEDTLIRGEMIGIGVALVILVIVFGALVAAGVPLVVGGVAIVTAVGATAILGNAFELSFFVVNMITMMGLALGIDYSLVIVQRFREELAHGRSVDDAVAISGNTAARAVLISGATVLVSLVGLLVVRSTIMVSLGMGAMVVAVTAVLTALFLLPAILKLLGTRVNKGRIPTAHPGEEPRTWSAIARTVIRRPAIAAIAGAAVLLALAAPALSMRLTFPGTDALPDDLPFKQAAQTLVDEFGYGQSGTLVAIENAGGARAEIDQLAADIEALPAFAETSVEWVGDTAFIDTRDVYDSADPAAEQAILDLRDDVPAALEGTGAVAWVGGGQADVVDFTDVVMSAAPWVALIVLGTSMLLLLVTFRSLTIATTAILMNVLSTAAAYGVLVMVFQWGWGADVLGMPVVGGIAPWIPVFLFAVLFGLSMDYHVFLLSRIKERHGQTGDTKDAIAFGLSRTGSLITGAALIMVAVFSGFALGDLAEFNMMGLGLAVAVILDATIVRTLLVPAVMTLLGERNWYLPRWLGWLPQLQVEGDAHDLESLTDGDDERELEPALVR